MSVYMLSEVIAAPVWSMIMSATFFVATFLPCCSRIRTIVSTHYALLQLCMPIGRYYVYTYIIVYHGGCVCFLYVVLQLTVVLTLLRVLRRSVDNNRRLLSDAVRFQLEQLPVEQEKVTSLRQKVDNLQAIIHMKADHEKYSLSSFDAF